MTSTPDSSQPVPDAAAPRRTGKRVFWGVVLVLAAIALLFGGIQGLVDPDAVIARSSHTSRSPDTDTEAKIGGMLLCFFGIIVLGYGISLFGKKQPRAGSQPRDEAA